MGNRYLAKKQPNSFLWSDENVKWCEERLGHYPDDRQQSCVIPFLWQGQKQEGFVSVPMIEHIAKQLSMPYIRVYEVASFYTMFNLAPVGKFFIQLCGTTPCMLRGAEDLKEVCKEQIGNKGQVTDDGLLSWNEVECLGACVNAPMVQINDDYCEDLNKASLRQIINDIKNGKALKIGSYEKARHNSAPVGGQVTLTDKKLYPKKMPTQIKFQVEE